MKKFVVAGFAAIVIAALAPQTQAAPPARHQAPAAATHTQTKGPAKTVQARSHGAPASRLAGKPMVGQRGHDMKVAHDNRLVRGQRNPRDERGVRDERRRHEEQLRNERLRRERFDR